jgi:hypothetical protein
MLNLFPITVFERRYGWQLFLALLVVAGLNACQNASAPSATPAPTPTVSMPAPPPPPPAPAPAPVVLPPTPPGAANGSGVPLDARTTDNAKRAKKAAKPTAGDGSAPIPQFDWPPPKASAEESIPDKWLRTGPATRLADVADKFEKALRLAHYEQRSYYAVPHGFALATQLEQIKADGTPMSGADRWKVGTPSVGNLSLLTFVEALAHAPAGYYRAIVFVVTDAPWVQSTTAPSDARIKGWAGSGAQALPASIGALPYGEGYRSQALIYEFRKGTSGAAQTVLPSSVSGETHLDKGGIWEPLSIL